MQKRTILLLLLAISVLAMAPVAFAQATATGTISGTVTDQSGAVIVGADVQVTQKSTGITRTTSTNQSGTFTFELLPASVYDVRVSKSGFTTVVNKAELLVGTTATVNASLKPGTAQEVIEVTSTSALIDTEKTGVSQSVTPAEVENLPLIGRDAANLAYLAPGVKAADSYDPTKSRYAVMAINGSDGRNINTTVNGIDNKDNTVGGAVMQLPLEAVQEFQISTQRFSAENGRSQGAAINMVTKQGTNNYHGSGFGYFREGVLDLDQRVPDGAGGTTKAHPDYSRQFFGGSIGGPIKKDKLFTFFAIEREREDQSLAVTPKALAELTLAQQLGLAAQPSATIPRPFHETRYNGRMDWTINNRNSAYVSYSSQANDSLNDQSDSTMDLTEGNFTVNHLQVANLTFTSQLSNTTINQFTFGFQYWNNLIDTKNKVPLISFPDASFGTNQNVPQQSFQRKWQWKDDISKVVGKHTFKAGVDFIHNPVEGGFFEFNPTLNIQFNTNPSDILANPAQFPQGLGSKGLISGMTQANGDPNFIVATKQLGLYFQDDWKVAPRLTLNLGLRYDKDFNTFGDSDIPHGRTFAEMQAIGSPFARPAHTDNLDFSPRVGFAYDVTGAGKHVLRGGFGLYYGNTFQNIPLFMEQETNPTVFTSVLSISGDDPVPGTNNATFPNGIPLSQWQFGISPLPTIPAASATLPPGSVGRLIDPNYRNPVAEEFNLGYSWALTPTSVIEVEYTHVLGLHENKTINIDQKVPCTLLTVNPCANALATVDVTDSNGNVIGTYQDVNMVRPLDSAFALAGVNRLNSVRVEESINRNRYDGLNFSFRQRMTHHVSINANYTLSRAVGYDSGGGTDTFFRNYPRDPSKPLSAIEFGPSTTDERHHITFSGIVDLPFGFQIAPIMQFGTARPYNPDSSDNTLNVGGGSQLAVVVPNSSPTAFTTFTAGNLAQFSSSINATGDISTDAQGAADAAARVSYFITKNCTVNKYDPLRGAPFFQMDMRLSKNVKIGERMNLQFIAQAFNLTNRANYGNNFGLDITSSTFGKPIGFINPTSTYQPRSLLSEFGLRFTF
jgi:outer membrane receptor protein involved in Fe transport